MNRRGFLQSLAAGIALPSLATPAQRRQATLGFSTLGCPAWDWIAILDFAAKHGFGSIELRGLQTVMDLTERPEFSPERIGRSRKELADRGVRVSCLGSSARMHETDLAGRQTQMAEARRFIDLAATLGAPYVRVFGDRLDATRREQVLAHVSSGLRELGSYAGDRGVVVVIESHGDFVESPTLKELLERTASPHVALLWDAHHTFAAGKEEPEQTIEQLGRYIRHTHLKDSRPGEKERQYVLTGEGDVPVKRQVQLLAKSGYTGDYSFEWEKRWHPEIPEPEVAFPHFARVLREYLA
ncbi:MAG: sugar phosphate isomerase/epimerase family protein [Vicinamibacterales bacterium]